MTDLLDLHRITTDADYCDALDELEQLAGVAQPRRSERMAELTALIAEYESRVARLIVDALKGRPPTN